MSSSIFLYGSLATHRRGKVLADALSAQPVADLPDPCGVLIAFAEEFQNLDDQGQASLIEWTRLSGRLLLLVPPFAATTSQRPVHWGAERRTAAPTGGSGLAGILASEVAYRLLGDLQTPQVPDAVWSDLSASVGTYRLHPAGGLFAITCLPLWSLTVLDASRAAKEWLGALVQLSGAPSQAQPKPTAPLQPDHYALLVFLLAGARRDEDQALAALRRSEIFRLPEARARALLVDLQERRLVVAGVPTDEAKDLVMQSQYAAYLIALREVTP